MKRNEWADHVKKRREMLGMSQEEFAVALGYGISRLRTWEQAANTPSPEVMESFERKFEDLKRRIK